MRLYTFFLGSVVSFVCFSMEKAENSLVDCLDTHLTVYKLLVSSEKIKMIQERKEQTTHITLKITYKYDTFTRFTLGICKNHEQTLYNLRGSTKFNTVHLGVEWVHKEDNVYRLLWYTTGGKEAPLSFFTSATGKIIYKKIDSLYTFVMQERKKRKKFVTTYSK